MNRALPHRRSFLHLAVGAAALPMLSRVAQAQAYPSRPVRMVVGFPTGGSQDTIGRLVGQWLSERLGQQVMIDNRPGDAGNVGVEAVIRAPADGYTLLLVGSNHAANATLYDKLNFNFIRDIAPVAGILHAPSVLVVNPSVPARTLSEFIAYAKANPGRLKMASAGNGTPPHIAGELLKLAAGVDMLHVPYRGGGPAFVDLVGGQAHLFIGSVPLSIEHIRAGRLRALAVTGATRSDILRDIPTVGEVIPGYEATVSFGIGAPKGTPADIIQRPNNEFKAVLADPHVSARL